MPNFNMVVLAGSITRDPVLAYLPSQTAVVDFGLAINRKWKNKEGENKEDVCFIDCQAFGKTAETVNKYLKKGNPILVEGRLKFDQWDDKEGNKHSKHRVVVNSFQFLGTKPKSVDTESTTTPQDTDDIPFWPL